MSWLSVKNILKMYEGKISVPSTPNYFNIHIYALFLSLYYFLDPDEHA